MAKIKLVTGATVSVLRHPTDPPLVGLSLSGQDREFPIPLEGDISIGLRPEDAKTIAQQFLRLADQLEAEQSHIH